MTKKITPDLHCTDQNSYCWLAPKITYIKAMIPNALKQVARMNMLLEFLRSDEGNVDQCFRRSRYIMTINWIIIHECKENRKETHTVNYQIWNNKNNSQACSDSSTARIWPQSYQWICSLDSGSEFEGTHGTIRFAVQYVRISNSTLGTFWRLSYADNT